MALAPYVAVVTNRSARTLVGYTVVMDLTRRNQTHERFLTSYVYPDAVAGDNPGEFPLGRDLELRPGEQRVIGTDFQVDVPDWPPEDKTWDTFLNDYAADQRRRSGDVFSLDVSVAGTLFDDGAVAGDDAKGLAETFVGALLAHQECFKRILARVDSGKTLDEAFGEDVVRFTGHDYDRPEEDYRKANATTQARLCRRKLGDQKILPALQRAIRTSPFKVVEPTV
jgi:hypothetical protein